MKIICSSSIVGNDTDVIGRVKAKLRAIDARFDGGKGGRHRAVFDHIWREGIGIGLDPIWTLGCLADNPAGNIQYGHEAKWQNP